MKERKPHYLKHRIRLRARFIKSGIDGFSDYEIVEILLTLAIPRGDVKETAKELIKRFGNVRGVLDASIEELKGVKGIGAVTPVALKIIKSAAALYLKQAAEDCEVFADTAKLADAWRLRIGSERNEIFQVAYLDTALRLLRDGIETIEEGTIDRATAYPRRVIEAALRRGAAALILAHNHPNGDIRPSEQDKVLTRAMVLAGEAVSIKIVDHLIVSASDTFSFRKAGLL